MVEMQRLCCCEPVPKGRCPSANGKAGGCGVGGMPACLQLLGMLAALCRCQSYLEKRLRETGGEFKLTAAVAQTQLLG